MSVSEGKIKYSTKNYNIILTDKDKKVIKTKIQPWTKVNELKSKLSKEYGVDNKFIRLFYFNIEMLDDLTMLDYKVLDCKSKDVFI
jgi:hypothetical protein